MKLCSVNGVDSEQARFALTLMMGSLGMSCPGIVCHGE